MQHRSVFLTHFGEKKKWETIERHNLRQELLALNAPWYLPVAMVTDAPLRAGSQLEKTIKQKNLDTIGILALLCKSVAVG